MENSILPCINIYETINKNKDISIFERVDKLNKMELKYTF